jgi:5'-deoxynucleotidase YfbR-like HD superfamily hydrolase
MRSSRDTQIKAVLEAGEVRRCHVVPHSTPYTVAAHSYGALSLLLLLHPDPSPALIRAVLWHDVGERWLGDLPSPAKWVFPELGAVYEAAEEEVLRKLGLFSELTEEERLWLSAVDTLELWFWARNNGSEVIRTACERSLLNRRQNHTLPVPVVEFYQRNWDKKDRLSDFFGDVI